VGACSLPDSLGGADQEHRVPVRVRRLLLLPVPPLGHHGQLHHVLRHSPVRHDAGGSSRKAASKFFLLLKFLNDFAVKPQKSI
jgi:hypothetical protein